ncbi:TPA: PapB family radical SAM/SPASM ranthipeptide maturase [Streptococcus pneumoniae]|uniref:PapB family radical SAM/SPASM ranthipeptide maturase n=2 Tax=Streptococcus pneumoniae TaxID=1313 RepID=UPI0013E019F6|nr:SPASM domain-containing protein [Streptococcus pneumoniae]MDG7581392.1 SPASM domain-containing protein [Streptococcus pneumoniae]MDG8839428.1 SPASM domain-containing protein [Streptococcus pneumoniae]MDG9251046.1 SPASM domain-containing protein [Streptococcus pneumoniae]HEU5952468.1 SPASM domain-containing protein [Streptococcus pneumoniae]
MKGKDFIMLNLDTDSKYFPFIVKNVNGINYLYTIITNAIFQLDFDGESVFVKHEDIEKYPKLKEFCEDNFILKTDDNIKYIKEIYNKSFEKKVKSDLNGMTLMISQKCNLKCRYCYGDGGEYQNRGEMTLDTAIKALNFMLNFTKRKDLYICFFGGEPLMSFNLIKGFIEYMEHNSNFGREIHYSMTTNLTLLNENIKRFINDKNISLTVSLDGDKISNDSNRYFENGNGVYDIVVKNINELNKKVLVRATISPNNLDIKNSIRHLTTTLNIPNVAWAEADNLLNDSDYEKITNSYLELIDYIESLVRKHKYDDVRKYYMYLNVLRKFSSDGIRTKGCGAGNNMVAVDIDGKLYPCHRFVGLADFIIGDVNNNKYDSKKNYLTDWDLANFSECLTCIARNSCGGGCVNQNYYSTGSIRKHSETNCKYIRKVHERILESYISLDDEAKKALIFEN